MKNKKNTKDINKEKQAQGKSYKRCENKKKTKKNNKIRKRITIKIKNKNKTSQKDKENTKKRKETWGGKRDGWKNPFLKRKTNK